MQKEQQNVFLNGFIQNKFNPKAEMQILQTNDKKYRDDIIILYLEAFSTGKSQQYIDRTELNEYINRIYSVGNVFLAFENEKVTGALLSLPLKSDTYLPDKIKANFRVEECVYVAEMMVTENERGKGTGRLLLENFFEKMSGKNFKDAFIRVWDENIQALHLYRKNGFEDYTTINQTKINADGSGTFVMKKIYLHKKIN